MENKQIWMTVLIAFFVGVLASLVTSWTMGSAQYSPPTGNVKEINANRCQADGVCEVNSLISNGLVSANQISTRIVDAVVYYSLSSADKVWAWRKIAGGGVIFKESSLPDASLTLLSNGNVGIGMANPQTTLHIKNGVLRVGDTGEDYAELQGGQGVGAGLRIRYGLSSYDQTLLTGNSNSYINAEVGNVGIGTTTPTDKLTVNGYIKATTLAGDVTSHVCADATGRLIKC